MKILIKKARIIDPNSSFNGEVMDILIDNGIISKIQNNIEEDDAKTISSFNLHISVGWTDLKTTFGDPGFEHKETIESGLDTAASGGFTHIFNLPNTFPICDNKTVIDYQLSKASNHSVQLHPIGTITKGMKGEELAEMYDMMQSGAELFSDDYSSLNSGILQRALLYSKNIGATICLGIRDNHLSKNTQVNEGIASTLTGLKADPSVSEVIQLEKILRLLEYTDTGAHISGISTKESIQLIRDAKLRGIAITCDVNLMNVLFTESEVTAFDTLMKVFPVLRSEKDKLEIIEGLNDGTIDAIASDHRPVDPEEKEIEFDHAAPGCFQLQTVFSSLNTFSSLSLEKIILLLSHESRKIVKLDANAIEVGKAADITLFDPSSKWLLNEETIFSKYSYSPFLNKELTGKVVGIIRDTQCVFID